MAGQQMHGGDVDNKIDLFIKYFCGVECTAAVARCAYWSTLVRFGKRE